MALFSDALPKMQQANADGGETFIQRQRRLQGQQTAATASPTAATSTSSAPTSTTPQQQQTASSNLADSLNKMGAASTPVSGDGKIPPPQAPAPAPQAPAPAPQAPTPQPAPQQAPSPGGNAQQLAAQYGVNLGAPGYEGGPLGNSGLEAYHTGSGWATRPVGSAPPPAPSAPPAQLNGPQNSGPLQAVDLGNDPFKTYQASTFNQVIPQLGPLGESYQGTQIGQFDGPNQQQTNSMQNSLMQAILGNAETMNPQVLQALKAKNKEAALMMQQQGGQMAASAAAARGMTNGGQLAGQQAALQGQTMDRVLTGNRDLDIAALERNRADQLAALQASEGLASGQMSRATQGFGAQLAGQTAQGADDRNVANDAIQRAIMGFDAGMQSAGMGLQQQGMQADENFRQFGSERSAQDSDLQRRVSQFGINEAVRGAGRADDSLALQGELGRGGLALDRQRLAQSGDQFDRSFGLDVLKTGMQGDQFNSSMGFNYTQLGQQGQQAMMDNIIRIATGGR